MRLILHIGTEKTGTTALQEWLDLNDEALKKKGVHYCACLGRPNNHRIAFFGREWRADDPWFIRKKLNDQSAFSVFCEAVERDIESEVIDAKKRNAENFIISNEHLSSWLIDGDAVGRVARLFGRFFDEIRIVVMFRPQVDVVLSRLSTAARGDAVIDRQSVWRHQKIKFLDYHSLWRRWSENFSGAVDIAAYKRVGNTIQFFCRYLGLNVEDYKRIAPINTSLDYRTVWLKNNIKIGFEQLSRGPADAWLSNHLSVQQPLTISRKTAMEFQENFVAGNARLCQLADALTADDLTPDYEKYPEIGNIDHCGALPFSSKLAELILLHNARFLIQKAETTLLRAELFRMRGQEGRALALLRQARAWLGEVEEAGLAVFGEDLARCGREADRLEAALGGPARSEPDAAG